MADDPDPLRLSVRVTPGARRPAVGGDHDGDLVVKVAARAVEGRATESALAAVAEALEVPRRSVRLVHGETSRRKLVEVDVGSAGERQRLVERTEVLRGSR